VEGPAEDATLAALVPALEHLASLDPGGCGSARRADERPALGDLAHLGNLGERQAAEELQIHELGERRSNPSDWSVAI
jgi:hypothetical protein